MKEGYQIDFNTKFEVIYCYKCKIPFAVPDRIRSKWVDTGESFYCPNGHTQHYTESTEQKLKKQLDAERRGKELALQQVYKARQEAKHDRTRAKAEKAVKERLQNRIKNGVCPCCDRTFQNLMAHMKTKHPDYGEKLSFKELRKELELTQIEMANVLSLPVNYISQYERNEYVPQQAKEVIDSWLNEMA